jgi:hypothetical protein
LCRTPISVHLKALECEPLQLRSATDIFPELELQLEFLNEFDVMDVILNRAPLPAVSTGVGEGVAGDGGANCNVVCHVLSCDPEYLLTTWQAVNQFLFLVLPFEPSVIVLIVFQSMMTPVD